MENSNPTVQPKIESSSNENKMGLWLVVGLVVILLAVGGIYWYLGKQQTALQPSSTKQTGVKKSSAEDLGKELDSIDIQPADSDFTSVDQDLNSL